MQKLQVTDVSGLLEGDFNQPEDDLLPDLDSHVHLSSTPFQSQTESSKSEEALSQSPGSVLNVSNSESVPSPSIPNLPTSSMPSTQPSSTSSPIAPVWEPLSPLLDECDVVMTEDPEECVGQQMHLDSRHKSVFEARVESREDQGRVICEDLRQDVQEDGPSPHEWFGFKIVGDNIDKTVKPHHMQSDRQTQSLHYFHMYAVRDRVDLGDSSESLRATPIDPPLEELLPSPDDNEQLLANITTLVTRTLAHHMKFFHDNFGDVIEHHILHPYSKEMSKKSDVVSFM